MSEEPSEEQKNKEKARKLAHQRLLDDLERAQKVIRRPRPWPVFTVDELERWRLRDAWKEWDKSIF